MLPHKYELRWRLAGTDTYRSYNLTSERTLTARIAERMRNELVAELWLYTHDYTIDALTPYTTTKLK